MKKTCFDELAEKWPSTVVSRSEIRKFSGGILSPRYLANLDSEGKGIPGRMLVGNKVVYKVSDAIKFLEERVQGVKRG